MINQKCYLLRGGHVPPNTLFYMFKYLKLESALYIQPKMGLGAFVMTLLLTTSTLALITFAATAEDLPFQPSGDLVGIYDKGSFKWSC